jgi:hypothetical protein
MSDKTTVKVYVELLEEGTDTWRPTQAIPLENNLYKLLPTPDYNPEDEVWQFLPGTIVRCVEKRNDKLQKILVATEKVD